jgi:hypothetical protein
VRLAEVVLWGSLAVALYAYGLYPLVIWILSRRRRDPKEPRPALDSDAWPSVTLMIRAGSDEPFIVKRLENALALDYPRERLQILVGCSGEEDLTALLARSFDRRLIEVVQVPNRGDAQLLNACLRHVRGDVVVLSDARTLMRSDALQRLAEHFHDAPEVGGVCGKLKVLRLAGRDALDGRFARLENFLTRRESPWERLPDVKSGILAIRTALFEPIRERQPVDIVAIALDVVRQGYRFVYDDQAVATREASPRVDSDARSTRRAPSTHRRRFGLPAFDRRRGVIASAFWIHRVLRRLCPALLIAAFVGNAWLLEDPFYLHFMLSHELFYVVALIALYVTTGKRRRWFGRVRVERGRSAHGLEAPLATTRATF